MTRFYCKCFDNPVAGMKCEPGFDTYAEITGVVSVKIDENGDFLFTNDDPDFTLGNIDFASVRCGNCSNLIQDSEKKQ